jgi:hypothetical protein
MPFSFKLFIDESEYCDARIRDRRGVDLLEAGHLARAIGHKIVVQLTKSLDGRPERAGRYELRSALWRVAVSLIEEPPAGTLIELRVEEVLPSSGS